MDVRVESQPVAHPESPRIFYSVTNGDFEAFEKALSDDPTVDEWELVMEFLECRIYQVIPGHDAKFTTPKIAELGIRVLSIRNVGRRWFFQLQASDKQSLGAYWQYCRDEDIQFDLQKLYSSGPRATTADSEQFESQLTERQREVARTAARMGYYHPDGASATEIADELGISPSTLSTHLRRIMNELFEYMFNNHYGNPPPDK